MTSRAWPEPYQPTLDEAFDAAGQLAEHVYVLEAFAADLEHPIFSDDVLRLRQTITLIGNRLAILRQATRAVTETRPACAAPSPENAAQAR